MKTPPMMRIAWALLTESRHNYGPGMPRVWPLCAAQDCEDPAECVQLMESPSGWDGPLLAAFPLCVKHADHVHESPGVFYLKTAPGWMVVPHAK